MLCYFDILLSLSALLDPPLLTNNSCWSGMLATWWYYQLIEVNGYGLQTAASG